ncbi:protein timeless-like protein, partial [Dinothrombium tinctorium]
MTEKSVVTKCDLQTLCSSLNNGLEITANLSQNLLGIEKELLHENVNTRNVRYEIGKAQILQKHLIPLLIKAITLNEKPVIEVTLRILVNLTLPAECLMVTSTRGQKNFFTFNNRLKQLQTYLLDAKKSFYSLHNAIASLMKLMRIVLDNKDSEDGNEDKHFSSEDRAVISNCLILMRNLLYVPENIEYLCPFNDKGCQTTEESTAATKAQSQEYLSVKEEWQTAYKKLVWIMLSEGLGNVLLSVMEKKSKFDCTAALVQLITLIFKDQDFRKFQDLFIKNLNSESSEDDVESDYTSSQQRHTSESILSDYSSKEYSQKTGASKFDSGFAQTSDSLYSDSQPAKNDTFPCHSISVANVEPNKDSSGCATDNTCSSNDNRNNQESSIYNNSSCLSNSSEEELNRSMHKVIKQHQRSSKVSPSDSSDESNGKKDARCVRHPPSTLKKSKRLENDGETNRNVLADLTSKRWKTLAWDKRKCYALRRSITNFECSSPSDDDIRSQLKDFTIKFLHHSFPGLIIELRHKLLHKNLPNFDQSHFLWLLSYFLKLAIVMDINFSHIQQLVSVEVIGFLVFQGIEINEELELLIANKSGCNGTRSPLQTSKFGTKVVFQKLHLVVTSLRELIAVLDSYSSKNTVTREEKHIIAKTLATLAEMKDFRQLFLLLIRNFTPMYHNKQFLVEVITTNHKLLLLLESLFIEGKVDLLTHLKQFATGKMMEQYGKVLEDFHSNTEFVNDCVITMMHHVAGDLQAAETLFQPLILKTFSLIMASGVENKYFWEDLIEYIMFKFVRTAQKCPSLCARKMYGDICDDIQLKLGSENFSDNQYSSGSKSSVFVSNLDLSSYHSGNDKFYWLYLQFEQTNDPVGCILEELMDENQTHYTRSDVLRILYAKGIISREKYDSLKENDYSDVKSDFADRMFESASNDIINKEEIKELVTELIELGFRQQLNWIKDLLLETCFVKILNDKELNNYSIPEPVVYYNNYIGQSIPIVPYNEKQEKALYNNKFLQLLHKLGFHLPTDVGRIYPRIPSFFTPDLLFSLALRLGSVDESRLKFNMSD